VSLHPCSPSAHRVRRRFGLGAVMLVLCCAALVTLPVACKIPARPENGADVRIAKWKDDHRAAISVNYDESDLLSPSQLQVHDAVLGLGMHVDFELVTGGISGPISDQQRTRIRWLAEHGFQFFGHGQQHVNHDKLGPEDVRRSAQSCYDLMKQMNLKPVAFAYPGGHADRPRTRAAVKDAGFLSARIFRAASRRDPYIVPDDVREPSDWYTLPTLVMMGHAFDVRDHAVNDTAELTPYLEEALRRTAWLITTYHSINEPDGYGFYPLAGFVEDLQAIKARDFWVASINDATLYVRERAAAKVSYRWIYRAGDQLGLALSVDDGLPADVYDFPLTILVRTPATWRGRRVEVYDVRMASTLMQEVPADGMPVMLAVRADGTPYTVEVR